MNDPIYLYIDDRPVTHGHLYGRIRVETLRRIKKINYAYSMHK